MEKFKEELQKRQKELSTLNLTVVQKEYLLNCNRDGELSKKDTKYLKETGKWVYWEEV